MEKNVTPPGEWPEKYGDYLYRFAVLRLKDPVAAEDVVQEAFLAGMKGLDRFDGKVDIKFWLRGILRNKIVDYIRKASRETPVEDPEIYEPPDSFLMKYSGVPTTRPAPWEFDIHQAFDRKEFWTIFYECIGELKDPLRQAFTLKELEQLKTEEICEIMDITPNNLWVMIHRARQQLKTSLEARWGRLKD